MSCCNNLFTALTIFNNSETQIQMNTLHTKQPKNMKQNTIFQRGKVTNENSLEVKRGAINIK